MRTHAYQNHTYFTHGDNPAVLFLSGMHGDEYESAEILRGILDTTEEDLPDFLYIPTVSPSAVARKTRTNSHDHDVNRQFFKDTADPEARAIMHILDKRRFRRVIDVHEDPDRSQAFYLYDSSQMPDEHLARYRALVHTTGARLYTGVDDFEDKRLGYQITKGYISMPARSIDPATGFFVLWSWKHHVADRGFTLEIPGKAPRALKEQLLTALVPFLLHV